MILIYAHWIESDSLLGAQGDSKLLSPAYTAAPVPISKQAVYEHEVHQPPRDHIELSPKSSKEGDKTGDKSGDESDDENKLPNGATKQQGGEKTGAPHRGATSFATVATDEKTTTRRQAIVDAFKHGYDAYKRSCGDGDELNPISKTCRNWLHLGLTRLDALDTQWLMGMKDEFEDSVRWLDKHFYLDKNVDVSLFEAMIRIVGGLLSAYDVSGDRNLLDKASKFADRLMPAFESHGSGLPNPVINLQSGNSKSHHWTGGQVVLSEVGTVQMELAYLTHHTGNPKYARAALKILKTLKEKAAIEPGLYATYLRPEDGSAANGMATLNAPADSMYEYLLKTWLLTGKSISWLGDMWNDSAKAILTKLRMSDGDYIFPGVLSHGHLSGHVEQLACFGGGMMALSANHTSSTSDSNAQLQFGKDFTKFCRSMYSNSRSGLAPESVTISGGQMRSGQDTYALRPETLESIFYLFRATGDPMYREWGWEIFQSIEKHCKVAGGGYSGIKGTDSSSPSKDDIQHSWFFAETLKYLFLLFSDPSVVPLDKYVFNTEAHPLSIFKLDPKVYE